MSERDRSTNISGSSPDNPIGQFVARLVKLDAAGRARLKRNAGRTLDEARDVYPVFFAILPQEIQGRVDEENYFLVATLFSIGTRRERGGGNAHRHHCDHDGPQASPPRHLSAHTHGVPFPRSR